MWLIVFVAPLTVLLSCDDDEVPPSGVSFELVSEDVTESNGALTSFNPDNVSGGVGVEKKIKIIFDRPMAENAVISYTVTGTANKKNVTTGTGSSSSTSYTDFYLEGTNAKDTETLVINKGDSEAFITLTIFEDFDFEVDDTDASGNFIETVVLTLSSVVSGPAQLGIENLIYTLNIKEDDAVFFLQWLALDAVDPTKAGDVDLDFIISLDGESVNSSDNVGNGYEALFIPAGFPGGTYNMSYPYYSGTSNNVRFTVYMLNTAGTLNGKSYPYSDERTVPLSFSSVYTKANINAYTDNSNVATVQTMVKNGINYTNISSITAPASGSRTTSLNLPLSAMKLSKEQLKKVMPSKSEMKRK